MPVVAGDGIAIADVFVFVCLVAIAVMLWTLLQVRAPAGKLPVVGGALVNAIDGIRTSIAQLAGSLETFLGHQATAASDLWQRFILQVVNPTLASFQVGLIYVGSKVEALAALNVPKLEHDVAAVELQLYGSVQPVLAQAQADIGELIHFEQSVAGPAIAGLELEASRAAQELGNALARVAALESQLAAVLPVVQAVAPFLSLLQQLAAFESASAGGVSALERAVAGQQDRLKALQDDLAKLLGLAAITALGAVAIENLIRVARDPCTACQGVDLSQNEARLFALEMFGEE